MTNLRLTLSFVVLCFGYALSLVDATKIQASHDTDTISQSWAQYSPYFAVEKYQPPPRNCKVIQANILQRHGARYPTSGATTNILAAIHKLQSVHTFNDPRLEFLKNFTYDLGIADLVPFGASQSSEAAEVHFERYAALVDDQHLPFVRASSSQRVVDTATNWTAGFTAASRQRFTATLSVILSESLNDTLDDSLCPNVGDSDTQTDAWLSVFAPSITARLNKAAPGANLTNTDTFSIISLCPFETVAKETLSPFCDLFSSEDFSAFEYSGDLNKFYGTGYGQALGRVQGVGYVNELIARLTGKAVQDKTQTNSTLDSSATTFPINRTIYADFSHDDELIAIYTALGLFYPPRPLDPIHPDPDRTWVAAKLVPFSAQMIVEKLECDRNEYVRILVSDAVQPLEFCGASGDGLCSLDAFVKSQYYARSNGAGDSEKCFS